MLKSVRKIAPRIIERPILRTRNPGIVNAITGKGAHEAMPNTELRKFRKEVETKYESSELAKSKFIFARTISDTDKITQQDCLALHQNKCTLIISCCHPMEFPPGRCV